MPPLGSGNHHRTTASVTRGFRTDASRRAGHESTPSVSSSRGLLRANVPAIYQDADGDFGARFLQGLEELLDPILATLDALPAHFHPTLAPQDILVLLSAWLGLESDESWPADQYRTLLRNAAELAHFRSTKRGLELALRMAFPALPLKVQDGGKVTWSTDPDAAPEAGSPSFVVTCDATLTDDQVMAVARVIEETRPVHVTHKLRMKPAPAARTPPPEEGES